MNKKEAKTKIFTVPNVLAASRVPLAVAALIAYPNMPVFYTLITIALITDIIDGPIARRTGSVSTIGANLDGISDKLFYFILFVFLVVLTKLKVWQLLLIILQDIWVAILAVYVLTHPNKDRMMRRVEARIPGKMTSVFQTVALLWLYLGWPYFSFVLYPTALMAVISSVDYTLFVRKVLGGRGSH